MQTPGPVSVLRSPKITICVRYTAIKAWSVQIDPIVALAMSLFERAIHA